MIEKRANDNPNSENIRNEESLLVRLSLLAFERLSADEIANLKKMISESEVQEAMKSLKKSIDSDKRLSEEYRKSFDGARLKEIAIIDLVLRKKDYPDGKMPTAEESAQKLLDAIFGKEAADSRK